MITADQIRAARALLNWSQTELSVRSGLTTPTIANIELGKQTPSSTTLQRIYDAFDVAGVEFLDGEGVKKRTGHIQTYRGRDGFQKFYQDIDSTALSTGSGEFLVCNVDERDFLKWLNDESLYRHYATINRTSIAYRILIAEGDDYMPGKNFTAEYRWTPNDQFYSVPFYVYGKKVAYIGFEENDVTVFVVENDVLSQLCRRQFDEMWERSIIAVGEINKSFQLPSSPKSAKPPPKASNEKKAAPKKRAKSS